MKVKIELPELPEGFEFAGVRKVKEGEWLLDGDAWTPWVGRGVSSNTYLVASKKYQPPKAWSDLFYGWLAVDKSREVWIHEEEPNLDVDQWVSCKKIWNPQFVRPEMQIPEHIPFENCCFFLGNPPVVEDVDSNESAAEKPDNEIKVGDFVKVLRKVESYSEGWGDEWVTEMDEYVGNAYYVSKVGENGVPSVLLNDWHFPQFVLEKVETFKIYPSCADGQEVEVFLLTANDKFRPDDYVSVFRDNTGWVMPKGSLDLLRWINDGYRAARKVS
jgi:hypothetical protein